MATLNVTNLQNVASTVTNVSLLADGTTSLVLNATGTSRTGGIRYNSGTLEVYDGANWVAAGGGGAFLPLAGGTMTGNLIPAATGQSGYWSRTGTTLAPATATDSIQVADGAAATPSVNFAGSTTTGFFAPSAGAIGVSNAGTQSIEVDATGNVLIGGTLPGTPNISLNADGSSQFTGRSTVIYSDTTAYNGTTSGNNTAFILQNNDTTNASDTNVFLRFISNGYSSTGMAYFGLVRTGANRAGAFVWGLSPNGASFFQERMRLQSNGDLLLGGTLPSSPNITLSANGTISGGQSPGQGYFLSGDNTSPHILSRNTNDTGAGQILVLSSQSRDGYYFRANGTAEKYGGTAWTSLSDRRSKENVTSFSVGLDAVKQINPVTFNYIKDSVNTYVGVIAQDVENVIPHSVTSGPGTLPDGTEVTDRRTFDPTALQYAVVNAVKEMAARIEALEAEVAALKGA